MWLWTCLVLLLTDLSGPCCPQSDFQGLSSAENASHRSSLASASSSLASDGSSLASDGSSLVSDGFSLASDGSSLSSDGSRFASASPSQESESFIQASDRTGLSSDGFSLASDGPSLASDGSRLSSDGSSLASDGSRLSSDGSSFASDSFSRASDGPVFESDSVGVAPESPSLASDISRRASAKSSLKSESFSQKASDRTGLEPESPSLEPESPRPELESPSLESESPSLESESTSLESESSLLESESPSLASESPGLESESPSLESESPSLESERPSLESESPSLESESSSFESDGSSLGSNGSSLASDGSSLASDGSSLESESPSLASDNISLASDNSSLMKPPQWQEKGSKLPVKGYTTEMYIRAREDSSALSKHPEHVPMAKMKSPLHVAGTEVNISASVTNSEPFLQDKGNLYDETFFADDTGITSEQSMEIDENMFAKSPSRVGLISVMLTTTTNDNIQEWHPIIWDKKTQSAQGFLRAFCRVGCRWEYDDYNDFKPKSPIRTFLKKCNNAECFPCKCKTSHDSFLMKINGDTEEPSRIYPEEAEEVDEQFCGIGNCCPTSQQESDDVSFKAGEQAGCLAQKIHSSYVIMGCPKDTTDLEIRHACEKGRGEWTVDEPVTDTDTNVTYRNEACARCHGVSSFQAWPLSVSCLHFQYLYHAMSLPELLRQIQDSEATDAKQVCNVSHTPPPGVPVEKCTDNFYLHLSDGTVLTTQEQYHDVSDKRNTVIAVCNVTGLWRHFDADVQGVCERFTGLSYRVVVDEEGSKQMYSNLFCAMCNGFQPGWKYCVSIQDTPGDKSHVKPLPLTFLLGLVDREEDVIRDEMTTCSGGQWFAFNSECRRVRCSAGKSLNETNSTCKTAVEMIRGLKYQMDIFLLPQKNQNITADDSDTLASILNQALYETFDIKASDLLEQFAVSVGVYSQSLVVEAVEDTPMEYEIKMLRVTANMTSVISVGRDEVEESLVSNMLLKDWELFMDMGSENPVFAPSSVGHKFSGFRNADWNMLSPIQSNDGSTEPEITKAEVPILPQYRVWLTRLLTCPSVEFGSDEFFIEPAEDAEDDLNLYWNQGVNGSGRVVLMGMEVSLADSLFSWQLRQDGSLVVCVDTLEELLARQGRPRAVSSSFWQYALSMAAIPLSIFCLLVLLLVYALLPELRTQPGLNTMGTCSSLLVAQLSLLLASHRVVSGAWCTALGILVHMSWLSTFCWTSVCSVHMYRTFCCKTDGRWGRGSYRVLARSVALTLLLPGMVVAVVVGVSWQQSAGRSLGYSSTTCYLRSPWMVGLSMVLPLSLAVALNLVLFSLTLYRIQQVTQLQARSESETAQHVRACLRLSLLTGATWLFSLLSENVDLDWLRAVSVLANGGQGVLLLLSYVTTKRVAAMLMTRMGCGSDVTRGSSTGNCTEGVSDLSDVVSRRMTGSGPDV